MNNSQKITMTMTVDGITVEKLQDLIELGQFTYIVDSIATDIRATIDKTEAPTVFMCQNCSTLYTEDELDPLDDVSERVAPGETMPWGQCPDEACAAVCYPPENMTPEEIAQQLKEQAEETAECSDCDAPVTRDDPYFATPCGTFCEPCMREKHAPGCGICASEFDLETEEDNE